MELTKGERAALLLIVQSGRAMVLASLLNTRADDGTGFAPSGRPSPTLRFHRLDASEAVPSEAVTAEGLRLRGLVDLWAVGVVIQFDRGSRRKLAVRQVVATLTPYAAKLLGVKLIEHGPDECPRWAPAWTPERDVKVKHEGAAYPEPYANLVAVQEVKEAKGTAKSRRAG